MSNGRAKQYCSILTEDEEMSIVAYIKNKNRALQGVGRPELTKLIMDVLDPTRHNWSYAIAGPTEQKPSS